MWEDYSENYYNPSQADEILIEYQQKMKDVLLEVVKSQIENTKTENDNLKSENNLLREKVSKIKEKERELERQKSDMIRQVRKERLSQLMEDFQVVMYRASSTLVKKPKCNKCNDNRKIEFKSPLGKNMDEPCKCDINKTVYVPKEHICTEFRMDRDKNSMSMWFKENRDREEDSYYYDNSNYAKVIYKDGMDLKDIDIWNTYFKTIEKCQIYCDWKNK